MNRLPILLSIPHGGRIKPAELLGRTCITDRDLFDDSDPFVVEIYELRGIVERVIKTDIARTFVDLNRSPKDLPPANPDGLIKSTTCYKRPIYHAGLEPGDALQNSLIELYYNPYHDSIRKSIAELDLKACLDCHSMAPVAPPISPNQYGSGRPAFCISNRDGSTAPQSMMDALADSITEHFLVDRDMVAQNSPFQGGYITKTYGDGPVPWIQVEMNRNLYLSEPWFDGGAMSVNAARLQELNLMFAKTMESFVQKL